MSSVSTICWNPVCRTSVAAHKTICPNCGTPLDLMVDREPLRMVSEDATSATPLRVLLAHSSSYHSHYYTVRQCWASESSKRDLARTIFPSAKGSASSFPRVDGLPAFAGEGESTFLAGSREYIHVPFMVQSHVEGPSLREIGDGRNVLSEKRAAEVLQSLLQALTSLHRRGIIARVIIPDAIRIDDLTGKGVFVHLDFAEIVEYREIPGEPSGKIHLAIPKEARDFLAPETSEGVCGYSSDQYALAASLLYACGVRRRKGESWKDALTRKSLPLLQELLITMLQEQPRRRFGSAEAALSHLEDHFFQETAESDDDILDAMEGELNKVGSRRAIAYIPQGDEVQLEKRPNWLRKFFEARPQAIDVVSYKGEQQKGSSTRDEFSRFLVIALLGVSLVFFLKYVEGIFRSHSDVDTHDAVPTQEHSSSHRVVTQLGGLVSFEVPTDVSVETEENAEGIEVRASIDAGTLKFSSWSIDEDASLLSETERSALIERLGRAIFRRSAITSIGPLSKTREGHSFRDFHAEGKAGAYLTRLVLIPSQRAITMSTRASSGADESFSLERVRFIESLKVEAVAAH